MSVAVYLIIGFFVGAAALYLFQMQDLDRLDQAEIELKQARRDLSRIEEDHEVRVREAIATAKSDYQKKHDKAITRLKADYEAEIHTLEMQLQQTKSRPETPAPTTTVQVLPKEEPEQIIPILAANIIIYGDVIPVQVSEVTNKYCEPPILAQYTSTIPKIIPTGFIPPILAADISYGAVPSIILSSATGPIIEPPILGQSQSAKKLEPIVINDFEPPILAADIQYQAKLSNSTQPIETSGKVIFPPILAQ